MCKITIQNLLQELETKDRLKVQMRIAQALDAANKRGIMTITAKDGPITCLLKQIHHVITDILDPRTLVILIPSIYITQFFPKFYSKIDVCN